MWSAGVGFQRRVVRQLDHHPTAPTDNADTDETYNPTLGTRGTNAAIITHERSIEEGKKEGVWELSDAGVGVRYRVVRQLHHHTTSQTSKINLNANEGN